MLTKKSPLDNRKKMKLGLWYDANYDASLTRERERAKKLARRLDRAASPRRRRRILEKLLGKLPEQLEIQPPFYLDYGYNISFGEACHINHGCYFMDGAAISLGSHVFVGPFTGFYTAAHPLAATPRNSGWEQARPITVEDHCWLGAAVSIMPGVTIGAGSVVAAGSVVTRDVPPNSLVMGAPARPVRLINQTGEAGDPEVDR